MSDGATTEQQQGEQANGQQHDKSEQQSGTEQQREQLPASAARSANGEKKFDQNDVDRIVAQRVKEEQAAAQRAIKEAEDRAGKSELEAAQLDIEKYKTEAEQAHAHALDVILTERISALVADSDTRKDRRDRVAASVDRALDRDSIKDKTPDEQREAIRALIDAELDAVPEFKASSVPGSGGGPTRAPRGSEITIEAFRGMNAVERGELYQKSPDEYAALVQQETAAAWR